MKQRETKFRAWDEENQEMVYQKSSSHSDAMSFWKWVAYNSNTHVMEYTGLKDKHGKEIYEGDVFEYTEMGHLLKGVVIWNDYVGAWQYEYDGAGNHKVSDMMEKVLYNTRFPRNPKIIGTIHDKELKET